MVNGALAVNLEARTGVWHPEGETGPSLTVAAFSETGKELSIPGPLIRVRAGSEVRGTVHNALDKPLVVWGLGKRRGFSDSMLVAPGATEPFSFTAAVPGTYYYVAQRSSDFLGARAEGDQQLNGAIVVDPANGTPAADRVLVISWNGSVDTLTKTGVGPFTITVNGLSWPHTERLDYAQGDSVRWRVINVTESDHPMHLHGFYFRVQSKGDGIVDTAYDVAQERMAVTEVITPYHTMNIAWKADRAGNWVYHCHLASHISPLVALEAKDGQLDMAMTEHHKSDAPHQMYGLVMGIRIAPRGAAAVAPAHPRAIRVLVREKAQYYGARPAFAFVVAGTREESDPNAMPIPGAPLVLERGKPVAITIVNQSSDHASIHWHGIELESYPDGVPGWSGSGASVIPAIAPGDSLTVRFTPPRAGTFMYHSHFSEVKQISGGAYGAIVVVEPGARFDPETDKILFFGTAGAATNVVFGPFPEYLMNGERHPTAMELKAGTRYRFRLINLAGDGPMFVGINDGKVPVSWQAVAKDGYTLPAAQATRRPAKLMFEPGEIYDFEYTPAAGGQLSLIFGPPPVPPGSPPPPHWFSPDPPTISVPMHVN